MSIAILIWYVYEIMWSTIPAMSMSGQYSTRHFCHDLELGGGDLISSPVDSIASLDSPKKSYGPNSVGKNYFSATPFFTFSKNATGGHNA